VCLWLVRGDHRKGLEYSVRVYLETLDPRRIGERHFMEELAKRMGIEGQSRGNISTYDMVKDWLKRFGSQFISVENDMYVVQTWSKAFEEDFERLKHSMPNLSNTEPSVTARTAAAHC